ncbi:dynamin family protein [Oscillatoria sp. FACHB-1406]|uniref:dynamin family protein n=1 Tax=Oscillatoria sp. FACHB-1406 TaxID=2692846 RepID=UPI001687E3D6|nr:dynamin family protein [Oscillatoria sp. FACHB-1406]MBD2577356.1 dynamin family protein [Oscillatoria sp. FACHB-1406]
MSSQQFQETYENIYTTGIKILQYLQEMRAVQMSLGQESDASGSIEDDLTRALGALQEQRYQVAVIAAMKAGKSTFLNALIGADVLASETEACTVCRTDIRPIPEGAAPKLWEHRQGQSKPILLAQGDAIAIKTKFLQRTHEIRATANQDDATRFTLEHPIEALSDLPALNGLTLVDTPGPNEWQSVDFNAIALKQAALEALRTCDAILFILDYGSFKDNTNSELLQDLIEQRQEFLAQNTSKIYFLLNKIDRKTEDDRPIEDTIADLRQLLIKFGIPQPVIYPASAWLGLLAKLIQQDTATPNHIKDFKRFFSAKYARENEEGDIIIPSPKKIADRALEDSLIKGIESSVIQSVIANSGWNFLNDVTAQLERATQAIEDSLNIRINGWEMELQPLRQRLEDYKQAARVALLQVKGVKTLVEQQKIKLVAQFKDKILDFARTAKLTIEEEIDLFVQSWMAETENPEAERIVEDASNPSTRFDVPQRLADSLKKVFSGLGERSDNPYEIRCNSEEDVNSVKEDINGFCSVLISRWWTNTQDKLSREGMQIREELVAEIYENIQTISNDLSKHLGESLNVALNINPIQMLNFDFQGIDAQVQHLTETYTKLKKEKRKAFCRDYEVDVPVDEEHSYYTIDLKKTIEAIELEIDRQTAGSLAIVERTIETQIAEDFRHAEKQIYNYIDRFQLEFENLLKERTRKEAEADRVIAALEFQRDELHEYIGELAQTRASLQQWMPAAPSQPQSP